MLGGTEVTEIFGYLGSLCEEGVPLLAQPAFHYKFAALMKTGGKI